jgi:hypothetical protein
MDAALPARLPLEMLDGVRDVRGLAVNACLHQRIVEQVARGPDERPAGSVLVVAGLFAYEHDLCVASALAEDGLRPDLPQVATAATGRGLA